MFEQNNALAGNIDLSLPASLKVADIAKYLGIAPSTAYKLTKTEGFPVVKMPGIRRIVISRDKFLQWYAKADIEDTQI